MRTRKPGCDRAHRENAEAAPDNAMYESAPAFGGVGVAADKAYQNVKTNSDQQNARIEHDKTL